MTLFLDIGLASTQVVLAQGKQMVFARNLLLGGRTLDQCVADTMHISLPQAHWIRRKMLAEAKDAAAEDDLFRLLDAKIAEITEEILRCLMYCGSSLKTHTAENLIFVGGEAHNNRLCQSIAQRLNLPAQVGDPLAGVRRAAPARQTFAADTRGPQPAWAVAIGLGLGTMQAA
jgi:Tfp pilus assembly PilM family ATPase